jgi:DNA-binding GntR family transcriptional regulator
MPAVLTMPGVPRQTCRSRHGYRDLVEIDLHSDVPSYRQLADILRERITSGQIAHRQPLPSIAQLKGETGLATGTIRRAVAVLIDEGLAYVVPGRGTFAGPR